MKRRYLPVIVLLLILAVSTPAFANIYIPSFVQIVTGPLLWSLFIVTLLITIPIIFIISLIEALVLRRFVQGKKFRQLIFRLAAINALTSLIGTYFTWPGTNIWPGLFIAFIVTAVTEALILWLWNPGLPIPKRLGAFLKASTYMNAASYAALAVALLAMIYLPTWGRENSELAKSIRGTLIAFDAEDYMLIPLKNQSSSKYEEYEISFSTTKNYVNMSKDNHIQVLANDGTLTRYKFFRGSLRKEAQNKLQQAGEALAISPDGTLVLYTKRKSPGVFSLATNQFIFFLPGKLQRIEQGAFSYDSRFLYCEDGSSGQFWVVDLRSGKVVSLMEAYNARFAPARDVLAWVEEDKLKLYDCLTSRLRILDTFGYMRDRLSFTWSADGQAIIYLGQRNQFTAQEWHRDLLAVSITGEGVATIQANLPTMGLPKRLFLLP